MRHLPTTVLSAVLLLSGSGAARGASDTTTYPLPAVATAQVVTVHDLIVAALNSNLEPQAKRLDPQIQQTHVDAAWGTFDPTLSAGALEEKSSRPQNEQDFLSTGSIARIFNEENVRLQAGISGKLPTGTELELNTTAARLNNSLNQATGSLTSALFHPEYQAGATLTVTQPLLKDFGPTANLAEVHLAKSARLVSENELRTTVEHVISQVLGACFETYFAQENIRVKEEAIALAKNLVRENQRRVDEGRMSPIEVSQAQSRLAEAEEELILARNFLAQRQNTLRELTQEKFDFNAPDLVISADHLDLPAPTDSRDRLLADVFTHNSVYLAAEEVAKSEDIRVDYAKNQKLPRVDLRGSLGVTGLNDYWDSSYTDFTHRNTPDWSIGVVVSYPLLGKTGTARVTEARDRKLQAALNIKHTELQLLSAFDTALRDIDAARQRLLLVQDSVRFAQDSLTAEEKRLGSGLTTSYNVANQQKELSQARTRALSTQVDFNKAVTQLYLVQGVLADRMQVLVKAQ